MEHMEQEYAGENTGLVEHGMTVPRLQLNCVLAIAAGCIREDSSARPSMAQVVEVLKGDVLPQIYLGDDIFAYEAAETKKDKLWKSLNEDEASTSTSTSVMAERRLLATSIGETEAVANVVLEDAQRRLEQDLATAAAQPLPDDGDDTFD